VQALLRGKTTQLVASTAPRIGVVVGFDSGDMLKVGELTDNGFVTAGRAFAQFRWGQLHTLHLTIRSATAVTLAIRRYEARLKTDRIEAKRAQGCVAHLEKEAAKC
jgi:hypothetical protein